MRLSTYLGFNKSLPEDCLYEASSHGSRTSRVVLQRDCLQLTQGTCKGNMLYVSELIMTFSAACPKNTIGLHYIVAAQLK